jgi:hypothetical protein
MTITYCNGIKVEGFLLSSDADMLRVAIPGDEDVRVFTRDDGLWRAESGKPVQISFVWQKDVHSPVSDESHFICSKALGRELISRLMNGSASKEGGPSPFYVFSTEKQRVHITVFRNQEQRAS